MTDTQTLRLQVLTLLGGQCVECGEADPEMLEIDHKEDDGKLERTRYTKGGPRYYRRLLNPGGLAGKQLLCRNHNLKKERIRQALCRETPVPPAAEKIQFRVTTRAVTKAYFEDMAQQWGCPVGEAMDRIADEYQRLAGCLQEIHAVVTQRISVPTTVPLAESVTSIEMAETAQNGNHLATPTLVKERWWKLSRS